MKLLNNKYNKQIIINNFILVFILLIELPVFFFFLNFYRSSAYVDLLPFLILIFFTLFFLTLFILKSKSQKESLVKDFIFFLLSFFLLNALFFYLLYIETDSFRTFLIFLIPSILVSFILTWRLHKK